MSEIKSVREAIRLEHDNQNRRPSSSYRESHSGILKIHFFEKKRFKWKINKNKCLDKKFVRKEAIDMTGENEMKPKKYKLRGRKQ